MSPSLVVMEGGAVQLALSVLDRQEVYMLPVADELDLGAIVKSPLGMGLLTGKFTPEHTFPADDVRSAVQWHPGFRDGGPTPTVSSGSRLCARC